jgi:hypothetical protein
MTLALDVVTFVWAVMICGAEVPRPKPAKQTKISRVMTWQQSLNEIRTI